MPDGLKIAALLGRAVEATLTTPGRVGRMIRLDAEEVLVVGDLHGHIGHFQHVLRLADLGNRPGRHLVLQELIHGPYSYEQGGDKSHQLLDLFAALKCQFPDRVHFLPGNHEFAQATARPIARAGGEMNELFRRGVDVAYGDQADAVYRGYIRLIFASPLALLTANRVLMTHSLPPLSHHATWRPEVLTTEQLNICEYEPAGSVYPLVWGRDVSAEAANALLGRIGAEWLVTGHLPCPDGFQAPNPRQIVLDAQQPPAACCLFPATGPVSQESLLTHIIVF